MKKTKAIIELENKGADFSVHEIDIDEFVNLINDLYNNDSLKKLWSEYQNKNTYAKCIDFVDTIDSVDSDKPFKITHD